MQAIAGALADLEMTLKRHIPLIAALGAAALAGGCAKVRAHQGFVIDPTLADAIQPGVDNRDSVARTLGRPSFAGQFDANDWFYVSRDTHQYAYNQPRPTAQTVLHVRFDNAGNVAAVDRTGLDKVVMIHPVKDKTPTLGRHRSFFQELFGNIGQVGAVGTGAPTTDNPDGGS